MQLVKNLVMGEMALPSKTIILRSEFDKICKKYIEIGKRILRSEPLQRFSKNCLQY